MSKSLYDELGVERTATKEEIKSAYRKKAKELHPDTNKEEGAEEKFKRVCEAYLVLYDDTSRYKYDQTGQEEKPSDRKPIDFEEQARMVIVRTVFAIVDKYGDSLPKKNIEVVILNMLNDMKKEVQERLRINKALWKAAKSKKDAVCKKQVSVDQNSLLYQVLDMKIKHIDSQELLPAREKHRQLLIDKRTVNTAIKLATTSCKDYTVEIAIDPMKMWDQSMAKTWVDPYNSDFLGEGVNTERRPW